MSFIYLYRLSLFTAFNVVLFQNLFEFFFYILAPGKCYRDTPALVLQLAIKVFLTFLNDFTLLVLYIRPLPVARPGYYLHVPLLSYYFNYLTPHLKTVK